MHVCVVLFNGAIQCEALDIVFRLPYNLRRTLGALHLKRTLVELVQIEQLQYPMILLLRVAEAAVFKSSILLYY